MTRRLAVPRGIAASIRTDRDLSGLALPRHGRSDMRIETSIVIYCDARHLWTTLRAVEQFEHWNPYVAVQRAPGHSDAIRYIFANDPRSRIHAIFNGTVAIDDLDRKIVLRFGTERHFRFTEILRLEHSAGRQSLRHDLIGEGFGVRLTGWMLARRIKPMLLHANQMLAHFAISSQAGVLGNNVHILRPRHVAD